MNKSILESSFRDNSGFVFQKNGLFYRQINQVYKQHYDFLISSGLYSNLTKKRYLIPHEEITLSDSSSPQVYKIIKPEQLTFISYPYEWSFSMLKDAALLTLEIQKIALQAGMFLKDASAYNVQFTADARPIFIDTLSFEKYDNASAWVGYGQFCRHFLAPLALMSYTDVSLNQLLELHLDGVPLALTTKLLPLKTYVNTGLYLHLHLHAKVQGKSVEKEGVKSQKVKEQTHSVASLLKITNHLISTIKSLRWHPSNTTWDEYYTKWVGDAYLIAKKEIVSNYLQQIPLGWLIDFGANDGTFSFLAAEAGHEVGSFDIDPACVEKNYLKVRQHKLKSVMPLITNLINPSPGIGWSNTEREPFLKRIGKSKNGMVLAVIHHICIANNIPLQRVADFFADSFEYLIIEFVPKSDEKVKILLEHRNDIFDTYTVEGFETAFYQHFILVEKILVKPTERILYLLKKKNE